MARYYDTAGILAAGEYDIGGAAILLGVTAVELATAAW